MAAARVGAGDAYQARWLGRQSLRGDWKEEVHLLHSPFAPDTADSSDCGFMFNLRARSAIKVEAFHVGTEFAGQSPVTVYGCDGAYEKHPGRSDGVWTPLSDATKLPVLAEGRVPLHEPLRIAAGRVKGFLIHGRSDGAVTYRLEAVTFEDEHLTALPGDYMSRGDMIIQHDMTRHNACFIGSIEYAVLGCAVEGCPNRPGGWAQYCAVHACIPHAAVGAVVGILGALPWRWTAALQRIYELAADMPPAPGWAEEPRPPRAPPPHPLRARQADALAAAPARRCDELRFVEARSPFTKTPEQSNGDEIIGWLRGLCAMWAAELPHDPAGLFVEEDMACPGAAPTALPDPCGDVPPIEFENSDPVADVRFTSEEGGLQYTVNGGNPRPPTRHLEWTPPNILRFLDIGRHCMLPLHRAGQLLHHFRCMAESRLHSPRPAKDFIVHNITDAAIAGARAVEMAHRLARHRPRALAPAPHRCCLQHAVTTSVRNVQPMVLCGFQDRWASMLTRCPPDAAADGIAAVVAFTTEVLSPATAQPRALQISAELNWAMRRLGALLPDRPVPIRLADEVERAELVALLMRPLMRHLAHFCASLHDPVVTNVVRGVAAPVAQSYQPGAFFAWSYFASASQSQAAAVSAARSAASITAARPGARHGTLFVVAERSAAEVHPITHAPESCEVLLPSGRSYEVHGRLPRRLLMLLASRADVVCASERTRHGLTAAERVDLSLDAVRNSRFVYDDYHSRYTEPKVRAQGEEAAALGARFARFLRSATERVLLLVGDNSTELAALPLALSAGLLTDGTACPVFVPIAEIGEQLMNGEEPAEAMIPAAILQKLGLEQEHLEQLRARGRLCVFLDALDEAYIGQGEGAPAPTLAAQCLLWRGGINLHDWPQTKWVVTVRREFLELHTLRLSHISAPSIVKYVRLVPQQLREERYAKGTVQLGCLQLFDNVFEAIEGESAQASAARRYKQELADEPLTVVGASCSDWCPADAGPENAARPDGGMQRKHWRALRCPLQFELSEPARVRSYRVQAGDEPAERDPVTWRLEGTDALDDVHTPWYLLDEGTLAHEFPTDRWRWSRRFPVTSSQYTAVHADVLTFDDRRRDEYVRKYIAAELALFKVRAVSGPLEDAVAAMRAHPPPQALARRLEAAAARERDGRAAGEADSCGDDAREATDRALAFALAKTEGLITRLERLSAGMTRDAFTLRMIVQAAHDMGNRWFTNDDMESAPRWEVYSSWLRVEMRGRLRSVDQAVRDVAAEPRRQLALAQEALMRMSVASYASGQPQMSVGDCLGWMCIGDGTDQAEPFRRGMLACLPVWIEDIGDDGCRVNFLHSSIREMVVAAALSSAETPADVWHLAASRRPLRDNRHVVSWWLERMRLLRGSYPVEYRAATALLEPLLMEQEESVRAQNASLLLLAAGREEEEERLAAEERRRLEEAAAAAAAEAAAGGGARSRQGSRPVSPRSKHGSRQASSAIAVGGIIPIGGGRDSRVGSSAPAAGPARASVLRRPRGSGASNRPQQGGPAHA